MTLDEACDEFEAAKCSTNAGEPTQRCNRAAAQYLKAAMVGYADDEISTHALLGALRAIADYLAE